MAKLNPLDSIGGRVNKTSICSVVFIDIIDCSLRPVSEQIENKEYFNALLATAIKNIAESDRIILDTGDGAAIALMGAPEDALFAALIIRDGIIQHNRENKPHFYVRIGINLGPVIVVNDINGRLNILGDGINVAQRVMSFADSNQIMVSRSYYEVTSRLTEEITEMFMYSGIKHDKHVREHEVYVIRASNKAKTLTAYDQWHPVAEKRSTPKQHFIQKHWLALAFASFGAVIFVSAIFAGFASSGAPIPPVPLEPDQNMMATSSPQNLMMQPEPTLEIATFIDPEPRQPKSNNSVVDGDRKSSGKHHSVRATVKGTVKAKADPDKKSATLDHEVVQNEAAEPQLSDVEKKKTDQVSWQGLKNSFKQGSKNRECTQASKMLNQCQE